MKINDVSFSDDFVKSFKTEEDFLKEMEGEGYKHIYEGKGRKEALITAYNMHNPKPEKISEKPDLQKAEAEDKKKTSKA